MEKKDFIEELHKEVNKFSEEIDKFDDIPDDMHFEDWYDQWVAFMSLG